MMKIQNKEHIFGEQILYNEQDEIIGKEPCLLLANAAIHFDVVYDLTEERGGIMIPAHIDKTANSLISNLGFVPPDSRFTCAEVKDPKNLPHLRQTNPYLDHCRIVHNSDAHYLENINEPEHTIPVKSRSIPDIIQSLKHLESGIDK